MKKKIIAIAFVAAFVVPYVARLSARRNKDLKIKKWKGKLEKIDEQIKQLEQDIKTSEARCEKEQTEAICEFVNQDVAAKGLDLEFLKGKRDRIKKKIKKRKNELKKGSRKKKNSESEKKSEKKSKSRRKR